MPDRPDDPPEAAPGTMAPDLARDWITLWQSELSALATDREWQEAQERLIALWAALGRMAATGAVPGGAPADGSAGRAGTAAPPRPATAAAAPDAGDGELDRLRRRVAELERLLAGRERER